MPEIANTSPKFGEIYRCKIGFTDLSGSKDRPSVIISSDEYNKTRDDLIIASITSKNPSKLTYEFEIENLELAGLEKKSFIKPVIGSIHKMLVFNKLGELSESDKNKLKEMLQKIIKL
jgi:mRNA interferase MazF